MRTLLKFSLDVEAANEAIKNGSLPKIMVDLMEKLQQEAAYFTAFQTLRPIQKSKTLFLNF